MAATIALALLTVSGAEAAPTPGGGAAVTMVADGLREPHTLRTAPDGRLFLLQQAGRVRIVQRGRLLRQPALRLDPDVIVEHANSAGLLGIAFPPGFRSAAVQHVYLLYTHEPTAEYPYRHNVVSRWVIAGNTIDPASEQVLIHLDPLTDLDGAFATSHYGGDLEFGKDGKLYVSTGDLYASVHGQSLETLHGKILRYNPDGTIPTGNPYAGVLAGRLQAIWATGLRNPFKLTFDRGDLVIADVGSTRFEEINVLPEGRKGLNFGWASVEGYTTDPAYVSPRLAYPHMSTTELAGCAVIGGDMYRPRDVTFPSLDGQYLFADFCEGWIRPFDRATGQVGEPVASGFHAPVDIAVTRGGTIWVAERQLAEGTPGGLFRIDPLSSDGAPVITGQPRDATVPTGSSATFTVLAAGTAPLAYQWLRNGTAISGATSSSYTLPTVTSADSGARFSVRVSNSFGTVTSQSAVLTVDANTAPVAVITSPASGSLFSAGETLRVSGGGSDVEDGALPASLLSWEVELHHNTHVHPVVGPVEGVATLDVPLSRTVETDTDIFYRVRLTVTDRDGASSVVTRDVHPRLTTFTLSTVPSALPLQVDGTSTATPATIASVVGTTRTVGAADATRSGITWQLDSWAGGSTAGVRTFNAPLTATGFEAFFRPAGGSVGTGSGLRATYFSDAAWQSPVETRVDRVPFFTWSGAPVPTAPKDDWSARWTGDLQAQFGGMTRFWASLHRDETLTVRVGGVTVIDALDTNGQVTGSLSLTAGQRYPITISYSDGSGSADLDLTYGPDEARRSVLPGSQLYPAP